MSSRNTSPEVRRVVGVRLVMQRAAAQEGEAQEQARTTDVAGHGAAPTASGQQAHGDRHARLRSGPAGPEEADELCPATHPLPESREAPSRSRHAPRRPAATTTSGHRLGAGVRRWRRRKQEPGEFCGLVLCCAAHQSMPRSQFLVDVRQSTARPPTAPNATHRFPECVLVTPDQLPSTCLKRVLHRLSPRISHPGAGARPANTTKGLVPCVLSAF